MESMTSLHPESGEKIVSGRLQSQGICVQRERIRESLCRVDPGGVQLRRDLYALHFVLFL